MTRSALVKRPWRLWRSPWATHRATYAIPGYAYATPDAAAKGLDKHYPGGRDALGTIYVADLEGRRPDDTL